MELLTREGCHLCVVALETVRRVAADRSCWEQHVDFTGAQRHWAKIEVPEGVDVWVTYPRTVREGAELLEELADLGARPLVVGHELRI